MTERLIVIGRSGSGKSYLLDAMTKARQWQYTVWVDTQDAYPEAIPVEDFSIEGLKKEGHAYVKVDKKFSMDDFYDDYLEDLKKHRSKGFRDDVLLIVEETGMWVSHFNSNIQFFNDCMVRSRRYHSVACVFHHIRQVPATPAGSATKWIIFPLAWNKQDKRYCEEHLPEIMELIDELHKPENQYHFILFDVRSRKAVLMTPVRWPWPTGVEEDLGDVEEENPEEIKEPATEEEPEEDTTEPDTETTTAEV